VLGHGPPQSVPSNCTDKISRTLSFILLSVFSAHICLKKKISNVINVNGSVTVVKRETIHNYLQGCLFGDHYLIKEFRSS
jgi:hypothetical protein